MARVAQAMQGPNWFFIFLAFALVVGISVGGLWGTGNLSFGSSSASAEESTSATQEEISSPEVAPLPSELEQSSSPMDLPDGPSLSGGSTLPSPAGEVPTFSTEAAGSTEAILTNECAISPRTGWEFCKNQYGGWSLKSK